MEITQVELRLHVQGPASPLMGFANIVLDHAFKVKDLRIIKGPEGLFIAMPSRRGKDGTFKDVAHPLNSKWRRYVEETVLNAYHAHRAAGPEGIIPEATRLITY